MKSLCLVLLLGFVSSCLALPNGTPITARAETALIPSASPTPDPDWRQNRTRQHKHVHEFLKAFGWLKSNETIQDRDMPKAIRKIQKVLREPETGEYDERMDIVMSRPRCGTIPQYNETDANLADGELHKRYVLWGPKWDHTTITYSFINFTSEVASDRQRAILSNAFAQWSQMLPISIIPAPSNAARVDIHIRFMSMGPVEAAYGFTNQISDGLAMSSGLINITFNDDYDWNDDRMFNFTAVHEIGHALGLSHSRVEDAVMWPYYEGVIRPMHPDDKAAIHSLYGWKDPRWNRIDNSGTSFITPISSPSSSYPAVEGLYQLRSTGQILFYKPRTGSWTSVDNNRDTVQIAGAGGNLYQRHSDGSIYRYTGSGSNWDYIGAVSDNVIDIVAASDQIYQRRKDGWVSRWTGNGSTWKTIGEARSNKQIAVTDSKTIWNLLTTGDLVRSEWPYTSGWTLVDINEQNAAIAVGGEEFYKLQSDGRVVWLDNSVYSWKVIEKANSVDIFAMDDFVYSRHSDGSTWRYTGTPLVWEQLDSRKNVVSVVGDGTGAVWEMLATGEVMGLIS